MLHSCIAPFRRRSGITDHSLHVRSGRLLLMVSIGALLAAGCGGSKHAAAPGTTAGTTNAGTSTAAPSGNTSTTGAGALQAEAQSAAAGDIPDSQVFLRFHNSAASYSLKYPEGWAQNGSGDKVTFRDKNNIVRVVVSAGTAPTVAQVRKDVAQLAGAHVSKAPAAIALSGRHAIKVVYTTVSAPNPVTGKRVRLVVDRYYLGGSGKVAIVDLGSPAGVDNVDAYRMMIESFRWR
jgi:hypothetical protein